MRALCLINFLSHLAAVTEEEKVGKADEAQAIDALIEGSICSFFLLAIFLSFFRLSIYLIYNK